MFPAPRAAIGGPGGFRRQASSSVRCVIRTSSPALLGQSFREGVLGNIAVQRLSSQRLISSPLSTPSEVVQVFGAVQAQDYGGAAWALGLRTPGATRVQIDRAFDAGEILRTHVLRPTWHFVSPQDVR